MFLVQLWEELIITFPLHLNLYYRSILGKVPILSKLCLSITGGRVAEPTGSVRVPLTLMD